MKCFFFIYFSSWQRVAEVKVLYHKRKTDQMALSCPLLLPTIQDVIMKHVGLTNPPDSVISSPKTKGSVIPQAKCSWSEDSANVSQSRTGQDRAG